MIKKDWNEFRESGLLWWINRSIHLFGWAIVLEQDDDTGKITAAYPARVKYRGFVEESEKRGFNKLTKFIHDNSEELFVETKKE